MIVIFRAILYNKKLMHAWFLSKYSRIYADCDLYLSAQILHIYMSCITYFQDCCHWWKSNKSLGLMAHLRYLRFAKKSWPPFGLLLGFLLEGAEKVAGGGREALSKSQDRRPWSPLQPPHGVSAYQPIWKGNRRRPRGGWGITPSYWLMAETKLTRDTPMPVFENSVLHSQKTLFKLMHTEN